MYEANEPNFEKSDRGNRYAVSPEGRYVPALICGEVISKPSRSDRESFRDRFLVLSMARNRGSTFNRDQIVTRDYLGAFEMRCAAKQGGPEKN